MTWRIGQSVVQGASPNTQTQATPPVTTEPEEVEVVATCLRNGVAVDHNQHPHQRCLEEMHAERAGINRHQRAELEAQWRQQQGQTQAQRLGHTAAQRAGQSAAAASSSTGQAVEAGGEGLRGTVQHVLDEAGRTINGAGAAWYEDNGLTMVQELPSEVTRNQNEVGRFIGHTVALGQSVQEIVGGHGMMVAGASEMLATAPAAGTGGGAVLPTAGAVTATTGALIAGHGVYVAANTIINIFSENNAPESSGVGAPQDAANEPYNVAKGGGKHAGFYREFSTKPDAEIQRGINSIEKQIAEHQDKIRNPERHIPDFGSLDPRQQKALVEQKWPSDIARQQEQKAILEGILKERTQ